MSSGTNTSSNPSAEKTQHRATWASPLLFRLVEEGKIGHGAAWIAMLIYAFDRSPKGCFIGNKALGKRIGRSARTVANILKELKEAGVLFIRYKDGRRFLSIISAGDQSPETLRSLPYNVYLQSDHWKEVRTKCLQRDGFRCRICNASKNLHVHHRTYENLGCEKDGDVITLCKTCHERHHRILPESGEGGAE